MYIALIDGIVVRFRSWIIWTTTTVSSTNQTTRHYSSIIHERLKRKKADRIYALVMVRCRQLCWTLTRCCTLSHNLSVHLRSSLELLR